MPGTNTMETEQTEGLAPPEVPANAIPNAANEALRIGLFGHMHAAISAFHEALPEIRQQVNVTAEAQKGLQRENLDDLIKAAGPLSKFLGTPIEPAAMRDLEDAARMETTAENAVKIAGGATVSDSGKVMNAKPGLLETLASELAQAEKAQKTNSDIPKAVDKAAAVIGLIFPEAKALPHVFRIEYRNKVLATKNILGLMKDAGTIFRTHFQDKINELKSEQVRKAATMFAPPMPA